MCLSLLLEHVWEDPVDSRVSSVSSSELFYSMSHHGYEFLVDQFMNSFAAEKPAYIGLPCTKYSTCIC